MLLKNTIKQLQKDGYIVERGIFLECMVYYCQGTALVDIIKGKVQDTNARYKDVLSQIRGNKSHIFTDKFPTNTMKLDGISAVQDDIVS